MRHPFLDMPSNQPDLNFTTYAKVLAEELKSLHPPRITVGIFGGYGTGKTTLMTKIRDILISSDNDPPIHTVWFDAWRYDRENELVVPFFLSLRNQLKGQIKDEKSEKIISNKLLNISVALLKGLSLNLGPISISSGDIVGGLNQSSDDELFNLYYSLIEALKSITCIDDKCVRRIVVFIDDLDRCTSKKALQLIEGIKSFTDINGFMFVYGIDPRLINTYLPEKYGKDLKIDGQEYLEKMIQLPFYIPEIEDDEFKEYLKKLTDCLDSDTKSQLVELENYLPRNIRRIKRILYRYRVFMQLPNFDAHRILVLLVFQAQWPTLYQFFWKNKDHLNDFYDFIESQDNAAPHIVKKMKKDIVLMMQKENFRRFFTKILWPLFGDPEAKKISFCLYPLLGMPLSPVEKSN